MGLSEYEVSLEGRGDATPSFKSANNLDFFRGAPGSVFCPCIYDDGDCSKDSPANLKTFMDVQEMEACMYARWGMARFEQHQHRQVCTNAFDDGAEPKKDCSLKHEHFMRMLSPMFNE
eukprot:4552669-Amphidinium_carterae.1